MNKTTTRSPPLAFPPRTKTRNQDKRQYKSSQPSPLECKQKDYNTQIYTDIATTDLVTKPPQENHNASKKNKTRKQRAIAHRKKR